MKTLASELEPFRRRMAGVSNRPIDLLPLMRLDLLRSLWSCEAADEGWGEAFDVRLASVEERTGRRSRWRGQDADALLDHIDESKLTAPSLILAPYQLTDEWRKATNGRPGRILLPPGLDRPPSAVLTNKIETRKWLRRLQIPVPQSVVVDSRQLQYKRLEKILGERMVVQTPTGSSGIGTFCVRTEDDIDKIVTRYPSVPVWLASRYSGALTINTHGLAGRGGVAVSPPSVQLSNISSVGAGFGVYCGTDFGLANSLPSLYAKESACLTSSIGQELLNHGYLGIFGVDFAVGDGGLLVLEINGRIQASTWLLGEMEVSRGVLPMQVSHVLALNGSTVSTQPVSGDLQGTQLVVRNRYGPVRIAHSLSAGIYVLDDERNLAWRRFGIGLLDCGADEYYVGGLPRTGITVESGAVLARIACHKSLATDDGQSLDRDGHAVVEALLAALGQPQVAC
ncbi:ATP-grasp domain-containing protein [Nocardia vinacea]|uniref:ATP-grasp domain-containing protein n=1 Tax=Nocardia vinacea TaxID=96468 RepID=UPI00031F4B94|nr:ATP-grasp domain-containing protein [Nocardia vinacea]